MGSRIKTILLHIIAYLFIISVIFTLSSFFYIPIKDTIGMEYIYSRLLFIIHSINLFSSGFILYLLWKILIKKDFYFLMVFFVVVLILFYFNVFIYL